MENNIVNISKEYMLPIIVIISSVTYLTTRLYPFTETNILMLINKISGLVACVGAILIFVIANKSKRISIYTRIIITALAVLTIALTYDLIILVRNMV